MEVNRNNLVNSDRPHCFRLHYIEQNYHMDLEYTGSLFHRVEELKIIQKVISNID